MSHLERLRDHIKTKGKPADWGFVLPIDSSTELCLFNLGNIQVTSPRDWHETATVSNVVAQEWLEFFGINTEVIEA
jgi:hypothetical protein